MWRYRAPTHTERRAYEEGMAAFNRGDFMTAAERLESVTRGPDLRRKLARFYAAQARYRHGVDLLNRGDYHRATEQLEASAALVPGPLSLSRYLVACYVGQGDYARAAETLEDLSGRDPDDVGVSVRLALAHWKSYRADKALEVLERAVNRHPGEPTLHRLRGTILAAMDRYDQARDDFEVAVEAHPNSVESRQRLAWCCAALGDHTAALGHLHRAATLRPSDPLLVKQLALAAQAVSEQGGRADLSVDLPVASLSRDDASIEQLSELVAGDPDFVEAFLALPPADVEHEVLTLLAVTLERAVQRHPSYPDLHYHGSRVYERLGLREAALAASKRAIEINPRYVHAMVHMGRLFESTDRRAEAIERLEAALEAGAADPNVYYVLGNLHRAEGHLDRARRSYEQALDLDAGFGDARRALETLAA